MTINLFLDNPEETLIASFNDMLSNPFTEGSIIGLTVDDLLPIQKNITGKTSILRIKNLIEKFDKKKVKAVRIRHYFRIACFGTPIHVVEIHCQFFSEDTDKA